MKAADRHRHIQMTPAIGDVEDRKRIRIALLLFFCTVAIVFAVSPVITDYDSYPVFPTAASIVNHHTLNLDVYRHVHALSTSYTVTHENGHLLTYFPWVVSIFAIPSVIVINLLHLIGGPSVDHVVATRSFYESLAQMWSASIVTALACTVMTLLAYRRLDGSPQDRRRLALLCGAVLAFGTTAWSEASRSLWQHGPALLLLALGLLAIDGIFPTQTHQHDSADRRAFAAGAAFSFAIAIRPTNAIAFLLVGAIFLWKQWRLVVPYLLAAVLVIVPWSITTRVTYGMWLQPYDSVGRLGHDASVVEALGANLISPSRGLITFSPICLLAILGAIVAIRKASFGPLEVISSIAVPSYLLSVSLYSQWWAGDSFGPRYMTETLPFIFLLSLPFISWLARTVKERSTPDLRWVIASLTMVIALASWSIFVNAQGGTLRATECWNGTPGSAISVDNDNGRVWSWSDPQFLTGVRAIASLGIRDAVKGTCPAGWV